MNGHLQNAAAAFPRSEARLTVLGSLTALFPALVVVTSFVNITWFCLRPGALPVLSLIGALYGLPLIAYRLHQRVFPLKEGAYLIVGRGYSHWFGAHQIQLVYIAFPWLETLLRLVPGLFSAWLRAWGSQIGRRVYWTPQVEILDRGLLEVGDGVIFGHRSGVSAHVIRPTRQNLLLFVKRVQVKAGAFVGAGSFLGPGVVIEAGTMVPAGSHVTPRKIVRST